MCLVLDQFLWGHSSRVCDISCSCEIHGIEKKVFAGIFLSQNSFSFLKLDAKETLEQMLHFPYFQKLNFFLNFFQCCLNLKNDVMI